MLGIEVMSILLQGKFPLSRRLCRGTKLLFCIFLPLFLSCMMMLLFLLLHRLSRKSKRCMYAALLSCVRSAGPNDGSIKTLTLPYVSDI